jgi:hypothetical protein
MQPTWKHDPPHFFFPHSVALVAPAPHLDDPHAHPLTYDADAALLAPFLPVHPLDTIPRNTHVPDNNSGV